MKWYRYLLLICLAAFSCSPAYRFKKDKALFDASKVTSSFKSVADMNDAYFEIRENQFFEFYRQLFDSLKNSSYPGRYSMNNDTMLLHFYDKKGKKLLGEKAWVDKEKHQVRFFKASGL